MANWLPIVQVDITLNTSGSTREGFGLPLFVATTDVFPERVRTYSSITDISVDFPDEQSAVRKAALKLWAQTPKVVSFSVGRRDMQYLLSIPTTPTAGTTYSVQLTGNDGITSTRSVNATSGQSAFDVLTALQTEIHNDPTFGTIAQTTISGTDAAARLLIESSDPENQFLRVFVQSNSPMVNQATAADTAAQFMKSIEEYDNSWYFISLEDRTPSTILALAEEIAARKKIFFVATDLSYAISGTNVANADPSDWVAALAQTKNPRTVVLWHQDAAYDYPELAYVGYGAPYDAGAISWGNAQLTGVSYSVANGRPLTTGNKNALEARNCNYVDLDGGLNVVRHGKVSSGEWIDIIRGRDWLESDLTISLRDLLVNQKGGKITYDDRGITRIRQVIESSLERAVSRNFLETYTVSVPRASAVSVQDKRDRILKGVTFAGILAGAIDDVNLQGTVAYE